VSHEQRPPEADIAEVTSQLSEGMRTCRAMIANYRAMMASDGNAADPDPQILEPAPAAAAGDPLSLNRTDI
jgi:hypothetical protein